MDLVYLLLFIIIEDGKIIIWNTQNQKIMQILEGHTDSILSLDCHPSNHFIASGGLSKDSSIRLWKSI